MDWPGIKVGTSQWTASDHAPQSPQSYSVTNC